MVYARAWSYHIRIAVLKCGSLIFVSAVNVHPVVFCASGVRMPAGMYMKTILCIRLLSFPGGCGGRKKTDQLAAHRIADCGGSCYFDCVADEKRGDAGSKSGTGGQMH